MYRWGSHFFTFSPFHSFTFKGAAIFSPLHSFTLSPLFVVHRIPKVSIEFHYFENPFFLQT